MTAKAPNWTEEEFVILLGHPGASDAQIAVMLGPHRNANGVSWVWAGVCSWHKGGDISMLSGVHRAYLERQGRVRHTCRCGVQM